LKTDRAQKPIRGQIVRELANAYLGAQYLKRLSFVSPPSKACGKRGANVRPDFNWNKKPVANGLPIGTRSHDARVADMRERENKCDSLERPPHGIDPGGQSAQDSP
jgi:hypothetical protein